MPFVHCSDWAYSAHLPGHLGSSSRTGSMCWFSSRSKQFCQGRWPWDFLEPQREEKKMARSKYTSSMYSIHTIYVWYLWLLHEWLMFMVGKIEHTWISCGIVCMSCTMYISKKTLQILIISTKDNHICKISQAFVKIFWANWRNYLSTGAGFLPSTVGFKIRLLPKNCSFSHTQIGFFRNEHLRLPTFSHTCYNMSKWVFPKIGVGPQNGWWK